ncbi:unnamed protein product [Prunus armeniaca]
MKGETWLNWRQPIKVSWEGGASSGYKKGHLLPIKGNPHPESKHYLSSLKPCNFVPYSSISSHFLLW